MRIYFDKAAVIKFKNYSVISMALVIFGFISPNPMLTATGILLVPVLTLLLWRMGEPPALLFAVSYQWLQVFSAVLEANLNGVVIGTDNLVPGMEKAAWLGFIGIFCVALGMRLGLGSEKLLTDQHGFEGWIEQTSRRKLLLAFVAAEVLFYITNLVSDFIPSFRQIATTLGSLRLIPLFLILWGAVRYQNLRSIALLVLVYEFIRGMGGYFFSFKGILFLTIVIYLSRSDYRQRVITPFMLIILSFFLSFGFAWQVVKGEYRVFLNQGTGMQVKLVGPIERIDFLLGRFADVTISDITLGAESSISRLAQLEYFGRCADMIPQYIPYQHGRLWGEALSHVITPRILFPNKSATDDSARTNEFTGIRVAGIEQGTSIGIGYFAESYVDFGPFFMFIPLLLMGMFWGWCYRWFVRISPIPLVGLAASATFIVGNAILIESSNIKLLGGGIMTVLIFTPILHYFTNPFWRFLCRK